MKVEETALSGVFLISPPTVFKDSRGINIETYNLKEYKAAGIRCDFIHDAISISKKGVLRGLHGDGKTWKLISCLFGEVFLVVVNWDESSPQYKKWISLTLSAENNLQVLVPPHFGNGHYVLSDHCVFSYKQSAYYDRAGQFTIAWDNQDLAIPWPSKTPITSLRDANEGT